MPVAAGHDVQTTMNYYKPLDSGAEAPYNYIYDAPPGKAKTNIGLDERPVLVHDVRHTPLEVDASLDIHGFRYLKHESLEKEFDDEERIRGIYYREVKELLKREVPGAKSVYISLTIPSGELPPVLIQIAENEMRTDQLPLPVKVDFQTIQSCEAMDEALQ